MHAQFLRERHNVLAALQPLHRHPAELVRITSHSFLCHLQFLSLHSVPFPSVSFLGFSPITGAEVGDEGSRCAMVSLTPIAQVVAEIITRLLQLDKPESNASLRTDEIQDDGGHSTQVST
jgi:hypothetical protein